MITGPPSFHQHNLVSMQFIYTKVSRPAREVMLCEELSEFPQHVLLLLCNICVIVMSECCQSDGVTHNYRSLCYSYHITWIHQ